MRVISAVGRVLELGTGGGCQRGGFPRPIPLAI